MGKKSAYSDPDVIFTPYMITDSNTELFNQVKQGDERAFESLFKFYYQRLCHYACSMLHEMEEAEEVVQQVFINIWDKRAHIEISTSFQSYLYRAVNNASLNKIKQRKAYGLHHEYIKLEMESSIDSTTQAVLSEELRGSIMEAVDLLPQQCKLVFEMSRFEGMKHQEIADELDISIKTVENQIGKALKHMRSYLKEYLTFAIMIILDKIIY
ncbi:MAG TPA: RNA polymerase sigma-70 factor [Cytophagales bacterium]|nr:RNA polymerase sigma-70 factor [Cytophagales bacterium]